MVSDRIIRSYALVLLNTQYKTNVTDEVGDCIRTDYGNLLLRCIGVAEGINIPQNLVSEFRSCALTVGGHLELLLIIIFNPLHNVSTL